MAKQNTSVVAATRGSNTGAVPSRAVSVALIDHINDESGKAMALMDMLHSLSTVLTTADDREDVQNIFAGLGVIADDVRDKVEAIKDQANTLWAEYVTATPSGAGGAR